MNQRLVGVFVWWSNSRQISKWTSISSRVPRIVKNQPEPPTSSSTKNSCNSFQKWCQVRIIYWKWTCNKGNTLLILWNAGMQYAIHWQDESYACWASQDVKPFPPRILQWSRVVSFGGSDFFLRGCENLISLKQGEIWPSRTGHVKRAS